MPFVRRCLSALASFRICCSSGREGEELSLRIWDAGCTILYYPAALVYHRVSPHQQVIGGRRAYFDLRNALAVYLLRYPWWLLLFMAPLRVAAAFLRAANRRQLDQVLRVFMGRGWTAPAVAAATTPHPRRDGALVRSTAARACALDSRVVAALQNLAHRSVNNPLAARLSPGPAAAHPAAAKQSRGLIRRDCFAEPSQ